MTKIEYKNYIFSDEPGSINQIKPGGQLNLSMSLVSDVLGINTFDFVVESEDRSLVNFTKNDLITVYQDDIKIGIFHVQKVERVAANLYSFYAVSAIGLLDQMKHYGGIYTGQTMQEVVSDICGNIPFYIKHNLKNTKLYGWLPIATSRENLSQVLIATGACIKTDMDGIVRIEGLWDGIANIIRKDSLYLGGNATYDSEVTQVVVIEHQYIEGQEETTLFEGTAQEGDPITFSEPMYNLTAEGISILSSNANYAKISAGSGTLKGKKYIHNTRQIVRPVTAESREISAVDDDQNSVRTVENATLISLVNSNAVANRLVNFYKWVETINTSVAYKREQPGNVVSVYHPYDNEQVNACLQSASVTISSVLAADETLLVGYVPPQIEEEEILENRVLLTGSGEWTAPEGITSGIAVLIDGGKEGEAGEDGEVGTQFTGNADAEYGDPAEVTRPESGSTSATSSASASASSGGTGKAGKGGAGGAAGRPGRVYRGEFAVTAGQKISYSCGAAVAAGKESVTTFGELSSASGSESDLGYTDPVTGDRYAYPGTAGSAGGDGGAAGEDGASVNGVSGGKGYKAGSTSREISDHDGGYGWSRNYESTAQFTVRNGGGGGAGGNSNKVNGSPGGDAELNGDIYFEYTEYLLAKAISPTVFGGSGGNGAQGAPGASYGCGGDGGGGGGGTGMPGGGQVSVNASATARLYEHEQTPSRLIAEASAWAQVLNTEATAGKGGLPGAGKEGCIILYYGVAKKKGSGLLIDRNGQALVDKYGRYLVV